VPPRQVWCKKHQRLEWLSLEDAEAAVAEGQLRGLAVMNAEEIGRPPSEVAELSNGDNHEEHCAAEEQPEPVPDDDNTADILALIENCLKQPQEREVEANLRWRRRILDAARGRPHFWERIWQACKKSIRFYVNAFVWQYNPFALRGYEIGPFVLWDYQEAAYYDTPEANSKVGALWLLEREGTMVIDKSREMGATWWLEILQDHQCRFYDWQKWGYISRDADQVDKSGDPDSIFWKLDFIHDVEFDSRGNVTALIERAGGPLKLWCRLDHNQEPPSAPYGAGADVAQGTGATPSCLSIANCRTGEKVLRYANAQIKPDRFALLCAALCRLFHNAVITWEHAGPGVVFGKAITEEARYWYLARREEDEATASQVKVHKFGYAPSPKRKNVLLSRYYLALQKGEYVNFDEAAIDQMLDFEYDAAGKIIHPGEVGDDPNEARENHGDLVIADALSCKMVLDGGRLASRQPAQKPPQLRPEDNILTMAGRRAARRKEERDKAGW
jgi:hypothetical protein